MRRVVVTGMGIVSPLGVGVAHNWRRLTAGDSGLATAYGFEIADLACQVTGQVPRGVGEGLLNMDDFGPVSYTHLDVYKRQAVLLIEL